MRKYIQEGSLNSRETDRAFRLRDELALQYKHTLLKLKEFKDGFFLQEDD